MSDQQHSATVYKQSFLLSPEWDAISPGIKDHGDKCCPGGVDDTHCNIEFKKRSPQFSTSLSESNHARIEVPYSRLA